MTYARRRSAANRGKEVRLWNWSRTKGWYVVCDVMKAAKIRGPHATPKGLRHAFGIKAITCGVPINTLQQLFGHAQLSTTSIYADAMGPEKRDAFGNYTWPTTAPSLAQPKLLILRRSVFRMRIVLKQAKRSSSSRCFFPCLCLPACAR